MAEVLRSPGAPLHPDVREPLEYRLGHDFSRVRVHTDDRSAESARAVGALAYTVGEHIVFGSGRYSPDTAAGRGLLAHELVHVMQQRSVQPTVNGALAVSDPQNPAEAEAQREEARAAAEPVEAEPTFREDRPEVTPLALASTSSSSSTLIQRRVSPDMDRIRHRLTYRVFLDWVITDREAREALEMLRVLSNEDLADTIHVMEREGLLERLLDNLSDEDRRRGRPTLERIRLVQTHTAVRTTGQTTVTTTADWGSCSLAQGESIRRAGLQALSWLDRAIAQLDRLAAAPADPATAPLRAVFDRHFHSLAPRVLEQVRGRIRSIRRDVSSAVPFSVECHGAPDPQCRTASAYVSTNRDQVVFCPSYFTSAETVRVETMVHEMAHAQVTGEHITDRGYETERLRPLLTTEQALTNAESFGLLVEELASGRKPTAPPSDVKQTCPPPWPRPVEESMARAQRWNRDANVTLSDLTPASAASWSAQLIQWLGGSTQAAINTAKAAFGRLESALGAPVNLTCEPFGGGLCDQSTTHWTPGGSLHLCPSWLSRPADDRVEVLLTALYGFLGGVGNSTTRANYARLAGALTQERTVPTSQRILGNPAWTTDGLWIWFEPRTPRGARHHYVESPTTHERLSQDLPVHQAIGALLFDADVSFNVDSYGLERPAPFTPPRVSVLFRVPARGGERTVQESDTRPIHRPGSSLQTRFPPQFRFPLWAGGPLRMLFRLEDPDTSVTIVYEDTIEMRPDPMTMPGDFPTPPARTRALA